MIRNGVVIGNELMALWVVENNNIWLAFRCFQIKSYGSEPNHSSGKNTFTRQTNQKYIKHYLTGGKKKHN